MSYCCVTGIISAITGTLCSVQVRCMLQWGKLGSVKEPEDAVEVLIVDAWLDADSTTESITGIGQELPKL